MSRQGKMRHRQRTVLHWAQNGLCAGCGQPVSLSGRAPKSRATFDHVIPKSRGGARTLINGLLKHRGCNERRDDLPPTGCDRIWQALVRERLESQQAIDTWDIVLSPKMHRVSVRRSIFER